jgi:hypothetical protein
MIVLLVIVQGIDLALHEINGHLSEELRRPLCPIRRLFDLALHEEGVVLRARHGSELPAQTPA